jgi:hypothetical protein
MKDLFKENYKSLEKEIKKKSEDGKTSLTHRQEEPAL